LCGKSVQKHEANQISAHHWAGYDKENWLNVWWVCQSCNVKLGNRHDGSLSKSEAIEFIKNWTYDQRFTTNGNT
jgi:hypothetical protein